MEPFKQGKHYQFFIQKCQKAHHAANYKQWLQADEDYAYDPEPGCETRLLASRTDLPWPDARYRGIWMDHISYHEDVAARGFKFVVLSDAYTLHR